MVQGGLCKGDVGVYTHSVLPCPQRDSPSCKVGHALLNALLQVLSTPLGYYVLPYHPPVSRECSYLDAVMLSHLFDLAHDTSLKLMKSFLSFTKEQNQTIQKD